MGTAVVLGGGGVLGAIQVGMLRALLEHGIRPDLIVGTSVGALNGAVLAALPLDTVTGRLDVLWADAARSGMFVGGTLARLLELTGTEVAMHSSGPLRTALSAVLGQTGIEDLPVRFTCCAAEIETAAEHWFDGHCATARSSTNNPDRAQQSGRDRIGKGVIAQRAELRMDAAFTLRRDYARRHQLRLAEVARRIVARELDPTGLAPTRPTTDNR